jgi:hypothetical protein
MNRQQIDAALRRLDRHDELIAQRERLKPWHLRMVLFLLRCVGRP